MRARLGTMREGDEFHFLCNEKMAEQMDKVIALAGGKIFAKDIRSYGVVISVKKTAE